MDKLSKKQIILDLDVKSKEEAFTQVSIIAKKLGFIKNEKILEKLFLERELEISTGLEEGFSIPHAKGPQILKSGIFFVKYKNNLEWETFDNKGVKFSIFLLISENDYNSNHLKVLSQISMKLVDKEYRQKLSTTNNVDEIIKLLEHTFEEEKEEKNTNDLITICAIVACPAGLAHTYMAKKSLEQAGEELNLNIIVEAHGAMGIENKINNETINNSQGVILATDVGVDLEKRFDGIYNLKSSTKEVIKDSKKVINTLIEDSKNFTKGEIKFDLKQKEVPKGKNKFTRSLNYAKKDVTKHLMTGISYIIPLAIAASVLIGISRLLALATGYNDLWAEFGDKTPQEIWDNQGWLAWLWSLEYMGTKIGLGTLFVPFITGFIAFSIAGKGGLTPGFIVGFICVFREMGFVGGMVGGLTTGYIILLIQKYAIIKGSWSSLTPILFVPVLGTLLGGTITWFAYGYPFYQLNVILRDSLTSLTDSNAGGALVAMIFAGMIAFDLGGPINKAAYGISAGFLAEATQQDLSSFIPNTGVQIAIILPPLGLGISSIIGKWYYSDDLKESGKAAFIMGIVGVSEGAIPFAIKNPIRVTLLNVIGCMVAAAMAITLGSINTVNLSAVYAWGFPIKPHFYILSIMVGLSIIVIGNLFFQKISWHKENQIKFKLYSPIPEITNFGISIQNIFRKKDNKKIKHLSSIQIDLNKKKESIANEK
ncbi:fructose-specific PTS transporter subunit EIIC [Spiroplasma culicicola]|uniref:PTS system 2-O-a-mannosyl-D-glycerate specific transporter IIABC component n=1 Tax=Spiroplasma culicicola AES-1 TaxID=1276246 RepID=W6AGH5_9MOLU|nr:fructose-specific PTS transporter subunit EIIC [Spiroplasma culicicola]AHI52779.1 PTS system 2-O-a-mannosyl-D-glycerate specific transporter IIABC component [Spiroplasma culicicola AES-1]